MLKYHWYHLPFSLAITYHFRLQKPKVTPKVFPQIAIAIGVLTSNRGEGDEPLWRIGRGTTVPLQGAVDVVPLVPLHGAIVVCYGWGGGWRPTLGEWTWCHCWVPISVSYISSYIQGHQFYPDRKENNNEFCLDLLADTTLFWTLITQKLVFAIWGLCWYNLHTSALQGTVLTKPKRMDESTACNGPTI